MCTYAHTHADTCDCRDGALTLAYRLLWSGMRAHAASVSRDAEADHCSLFVPSSASRGPCYTLVTRVAGRKVRWRVVKRIFYLYEGSTALNAPPRARSGRVAGRCVVLTAHLKRLAKRIKRVSYGVRFVETSLRVSSGFCERDSHYARAISRLALRRLVVVSLTSLPLKDPLKGRARMRGLEKTRRLVSLVCQVTTDVICPEEFRSPGQRG